jgi:O-methyltransferase domain
LVGEKLPERLCFLKVFQLSTPASLETHDISLVYPWADLPEKTIICDVGGGNGHATLGLVKAFPHLSVTLQDLPEVIEQGKEVGMYMTRPIRLMTIYLCLALGERIPRGYRNPKDTVRCL